MPRWILGKEVDLVDLPARLPARSPAVESRQDLGLPAGAEGAGLASMQGAESLYSFWCDQIVRSHRTKQPKFIAKASEMISLSIVL